MNEHTLLQASESIELGSKSFAAAARLFATPTRRSAVMLYFWCRHCDDVVDGQFLGHRRLTRENGNAFEKLARLEALTRSAYAGEAMSDAPFAAFQHVVLRHAIPQHLPLQHLAGFGMDVRGRRYLTIDDTLDYCYHVAGVVGLMMAMIMGVRDEQVLDRASDLGIAFQLTNIVRDILEDAQIGRIYLPEDWLAAESVPPVSIAAPEHRAGVANVALRVLELADRYYDSAVGGISALPLRSAWAIATARAVYRRIGLRVAAHGTRAWDTRAATSRGDKMRQVLVGAATAMASRLNRPRLRPVNLWQRPTQGPR